MCGSDGFLVNPADMRDGEVLLEEAARRNEEVNDSCLDLPHRAEFAEGLVRRNQSLFPEIPCIDSNRVRLRLALSFYSSIDVRDYLLTERHSPSPCLNIQYFNWHGSKRIGYYR